MPGEHQASRPCTFGGNKIDLSGLATGNDLAAEAKISKAFGEIINDGRIAHVQIIRSRADARDADDFVKTIEQLGCAVDHDSWESRIQAGEDSLAIRSVLAAMIKSLTCRPFILWVHQ